MPANGEARAGLSALTRPSTRDRSQGGICVAYPLGLGYNYNISLQAPIMSPEECRSIRETAGLTRPQLADAIGVGSSAIKKYETGLVQISDERAAQITAACRIDAAAFWSAAERARPQAGYYKSRAANRSTDDNEYTANGEGLGGLASWLIPVGALLAIGLVAVLSVQDAA